MDESVIEEETDRKEVGQDWEKYLDDISSQTFFLDIVVDNSIMLRSDATGRRNQITCIIDRHHFLPF